MKRDQFLLLLTLIISTIHCNKIIQSPFNDPKPTDNYFSIAIIPDTQYYIAEKYGGTKEMFKNQINWIIKNIDTEHIAYVIHLGDMTESNKEAEWQTASTIMQPLNNNNIPFGIAIGNHDNTPMNKPSSGKDNTLYNKYFGKKYFEHKIWYGGALENNNNNDNHFDLIKINDTKLVIIYNSYNQPNTKHYDSAYENKILKWDDSLLNLYSDRKAIIVSHSILRAPDRKINIKLNNKKYGFKTSPFSPEGKLIYKIAKLHNNVFMLLCGHAAGEGLRIDTYNGHVIKSFLTNYQFESNGGDSKMRLMRINLTTQTLSAITFKPNIDGTYKKYIDLNSQFELPLYN